MAARNKVLWISDGPAPPAVRAAVAARWDLTPARGDQPLESQLEAAGLAVIYPNGQSNDPACLAEILGMLENTSAVAVLILPAGTGADWAALRGGAGRFLCIADTDAADLLPGQLAAAEALRPAFQSLRKELAAAQGMANSSARAVDQIDEEMRLAARLQRDFLPQRMPEVGPVRFGVLYRPATWLSGDIYDITRLDEAHVGFYVADAVGHGMPAALLTMFIKHALQTKRIVGNTYQIVPPEVSLAELNGDICQQNLSSCQFCTAVYGVLDVGKLELTYSRAGHPPPILFRRDGQVELLSAPGGLLGVFPEEQYACSKVQLARGDRLVVYTDGAEDALRLATSRPGEDIVKLIAPLAGAPREEMLLQLTALIDAGRNNPNGDDDITIMVVDVEP